MKKIQWSINNDLPNLKVTDVTKEKQGEGSYTMNTLPQLKPLPIPRYTDITGYWAEGDIKKLFSLGVVSGESNYYNPLVPINRGEFARAIVNACGLMKEEETAAKNKAKTKAKVEPEISYSDLNTDDPNYEFIQKALTTGIMKGIDINRFDPDGTLTKAQAVTTIVRALGLEDMRLTGARAPFMDENTISNWAKKSMTVAYDMGIIDVNEYGMVQPNKTLTRGECANLINRFITYLQDKISTDYRERIVNFR
jgi:S-layer homology domain.